MGITLVELLVDGGKYIDAVLMGQPQGNQAADAGLKITELSQCVPANPEDFRSTVNDQLAGGGDFQMVVVPLKEFDSQLVFQLDQLLVQSGLGDKQFLGSPGNAAAVGDGYDVFQNLDIHDMAPFHPLLVVQLLITIIISTFTANKQDDRIKV